MKEYTRNIVGIVRIFGGYCSINGIGIEEMLSDAIGNDRTFAGRIIISVTDLTSNTGAPASPAQDEGGQD